MPKFRAMIRRADNLLSSATLSPCLFLNILFLRELDVG